MCFKVQSVDKTIFWNRFKNLLLFEMKALTKKQGI